MSRSLHSRFTSSVIFRNGWLRALDIKTGALKGEFQTEGNKANAAKYVDGEGKLKMGEIYPDMTLDGVMIGLDRMYSLGSVLSSPVVANGVVYFGDASGHQLLAFDEQTHKKLWSSKQLFTTSLQTEPVVVNGHVFQTTGSGLYAFGL